MTDDYVLRAQRLSDKVDSLSSQYHGAVQLTSQEEREYSEILMHARDECDRIYADMQRLIPNEIKQRIGNACKLVDIVSDFRCFAGSLEQKHALKKIWEECFQRGINNSDGKSYTATVYLNSFFPPTKVDEK